jgi:hypothetical protein
MDFEKYRVEFNGEVTYINHRLINSRNIDDATLELIKERHRERIDIFQRARKTQDKESLTFLAKAYERVEFQLQQLWGFDQNSNYHRWFELPGCTCPKVDNIDRLGTPYRVYSVDCPVHGGKGE